MIQFPDDVRGSRWFERLILAVTAVRGAAAGLLAARGDGIRAREVGDQLKTPIDRAAEGWVLAYIETEYPEDAILAEERSSAVGGGWAAASSYWTVDALDGTRSYVDGYPGFCVQVAWVESGRPRVGVIAEPVADAIYFAVDGAGAFRLRGGNFERLRTHGEGASLRFVDSTRPAGAVGKWMAEVGGRFVECGSVGLKIARVAEGAADIYAKDFRFRLWDVAPGHVLAEEAGARVGLWDGTPVAFDTSRIEWKRLLVAPAVDYAAAVTALARSASKLS